MNEIIASLAIVAVAGIGAQWLAWRLAIPAIAVLLGAGFLLGPASGALQPQEIFGEMLRPAVALGVAVILFEGGLSLNFQRIAGVSKGVWRLVLLSAPIGFGLGALNGYYVAGLSWPSALVFAGILIVTGPTVIIPLLRQARLERRPAALLRWEAILADPLGALLAVFVFEGYLIYDGEHGFWPLAIRAIAGLVIGGIGGWLLGRGLVRAFAKGWVPEFLKVPLILVCVIGAYALSDVVLEESGLLTVTVLGVVLGNSRLASLEEIKRFKEAITIVLVSSVFIVLTASVEFSTLAEFGERDFFFLLVLLFLVRPLAVIFGTFGAHLSWKERLLIGWIAPRGIVAVAVSGLFATLLMHYGVEDGHRLGVLSFAVVAVTVFAHGFTLGPLARWLGLSQGGELGIVFVGSSRFSTALAVKLKSLGVSTLIVDRNWGKLRLARHAGLDNYYGDVLSEEVENLLPLEAYSALFAMTDNDDYNALVSTNFASFYGREAIFQFAPPEERSERERFRRVVAVGGRSFLSADQGYGFLESRVREGWSIKASELTQAYDWAACQEALPEGGLFLFIISANKRLRLISDAESSAPGAGAVVLSLVPKEVAIATAKANSSGQ